LCCPCAPFLLVDTVYPCYFVLSPSCVAKSAFNPGHLCKRQKAPHISSNTLTHIAKRVYDDSHPSGIPDPRVQPGDGVLDPIPRQCAHAEHVQTGHPFGLCPIKVGRSPRLLHRMPPARGLTVRFLCRIEVRRVVSIGFRPRSVPGVERFTYLGGGERGRRVLLVGEEQEG